MNQTAFLFYIGKVKTHIMFRPLCCSAHYCTLESVKKTTHNAGRQLFDLIKNEILLVRTGPEIFGGPV